jgi:tRNA (guanine37-N1)-methyltransferase
MSDPANTSRTHPWQAIVLTLFPELFPGPLGASLLGDALESGLWSLQAIGLREFGSGRHKSVDDTPAGGGAGMVMRADVLGAAIDAARVRYADVLAIYLSPRGELLTQDLVRELAAGPGVLLLAGRYEGIDERVIEGRRLREVSIGDYVLAGGEAAVLVIVEAVARLLPGFLGNPDSLAEESHAGGLLEYPVYTRPPSWHGLEVPGVLLSGDHGAVARWRRDESLRRTAARRPDLLAGADLSERDRAALD